LNTKEVSIIHSSMTFIPPAELLVPQSNQAPRLRGRMRMRQVECRNDIHTFTPGFLALYESLKPAEEHKTKQQQLVDSLTKSITKEWPNAQLHLYGSCANSFGSSHSDVDVCLQMDIGTGSTVEILLRLAEILQTDNFESVKVSLLCIILDFYNWIMQHSCSKSRLSVLHCIILP
jgi:DNA polymerase sigma